MSWYKRAMPQVKDVLPVIDSLCAEIKAIDGVDGVYGWGSFFENLSNLNFVVKDVDVIASTTFDSGDLLAIDNSRYSALRIRPSELEDEGFNPRAVAFTKKFLLLEKYNVDHWATTTDGKLLHWGAIPETSEEWQELHAEAEKRAQKETGLKRAQLVGCDNDAKAWRRTYEKYIAKCLDERSGGWCPSSHSAEEILAQADKLI